MFSKKTLSLSLSCFLGGSLSLSPRSGADTEDQGSVAEWTSPSHPAWLDFMLPVSSTTCCQSRWAACMLTIQRRDASSFKQIWPNTPSTVSIRPRTWPTSEAALPRHSMRRPVHGIGNDILQQQPCHEHRAFCRPLTLLGHARHDAHVCT